MAVWWDIDDSGSGGEAERGVKKKTRRDFACRAAVLRVIVLIRPAGMGLN